MKTVKTTVSILGLTVALAASFASSTADAAPVSCSTAFGQYVNASWLEVAAVRIGARWEGGPPGSAFAMDNDYNMSTWPIGTSGAASRSTFDAARNSSSSAFSGYFTTVHPDRSNTDIDLWEFWVYDTGVVWLRSVTWGGGWQQLPNRACFDAFSNSTYTQTIVTGYADNTNHTDTYWTFGLQGYDLI